MSLHHIGSQGKARPRLAAAVLAIALTWGLPGQAFSAGSTGQTSGCPPPPNLLDRFQIITKETRKILNRVHDSCGMRVLEAAVKGNIQGMKEAFRCQTNDPCVFKAAIDLAYHESKRDLTSPMDPEILYAVTDQESAITQYQRDKKGNLATDESGVPIPLRNRKAIGLMQVEPETARQNAGISLKELEQDPYKNAMAGVKTFIFYRNKVEKLCGVKGRLLDLLTYVTYNGGAKYARSYCEKKTTPNEGSLGDHLGKFKMKLEERHYADTLEGCPNFKP